MRKGYSSTFCFESWFLMKAECRGLLNLRELLYECVLVGLWYYSRRFWHSFFPIVHDQDLVRPSVTVCHDRLLALVSRQNTTVPNKANSTTNPPPHYHT